MRERLPRMRECLPRTNLPRYRAMGATLPPYVRQ